MEAAAAIKAAPPGEPDPVDLSRLAGYVTKDPIAMHNRQLIRRAGLGYRLAIWAAMVLFELVLFIQSGSMFILACGYVVTVPFLVTCYQYRAVDDYATELELYCRFDGC